MTYIDNDAFDYALLQKKPRKKGSKAKQSRVRFNLADHGRAAAATAFAQPRTAPLTAKERFLEAQIAQLKTENALAKCEASLIRDRAARTDLEVVVVNLRQENDDLKALLAATFTERDQAVLLASEAEHKADEAISKSFISSLAKPPSFSGVRSKDQLDARDWVSAVSDYLKSSGIANSDQQRIQFAESYLTGEAKRAWYTTRTAHQSTADTSPYASISFDDFVQAILHRWQPNCSEIDAMNKLEDLYQTGSLASFITSFDRLCSFIPGMTDREKIHKLLRNIDPKVAEKIATDPQSKKRWSVYNDLRSFALNYIAATPVGTTNGYGTCGKRSAGALENVIQVATGDNKRLRRDSRGGFITPAYHRQPQPPRPPQQPQQQQGNGAGSSNGTDHWQGFFNAGGVRFYRLSTFVKWANGNSICLCCHSSYTQGTKTHRQHCKEAPKGPMVFPSKFTPHLRVPPVPRH